ncbi:hypothetical protein EV424DRAFT_1352572 [Suillus variegatus]|nr:hypothetical protein EV424DRAFT_1352572 [Suillus variegatus]
MPRFTPHQKHAQNLLRNFIKYCINKLKCARRHTARSRHALQAAGYAKSESSQPSDMESDSTPVSSGESLSGSDLESTLLKSSDDDTSTESSAANMSSSDDSKSESDWDLSDDADDEAEHANSRLSQYVRCTYRAIYAHRYDAARNKPIPKAPSQLPHILEVLKVERPDKFREILRVNPDTFDKIVEKIKDDTVFFNNSNNPQQPVEEQLAITLYRFGHNGNAASQSQVDGGQLEVMELSR